MKEKDFKKEQDACINACKQLAETESAISHVFAVFDMKTGTFKNFNEELYRVKHLLEDLAYNSKRIMNCCSIIQNHGIETDLEYKFSDHLTVALRTTKERVYADFKLCNYPYFPPFTFEETIEPSLKNMITAFYNTRRMKLDLDNIQNSSNEVLSDFLTAVKYGNLEINEVAESVLTTLAEKKTEPLKKS